jgi:tetratricopeptide (TPR) repeat protein
MTNALAAEQAQRENAEATAALALDALNRVYDRFAPTRLVATPPATTEDGVELPGPQPALPPEAIPLLEDSLRTYEKIAKASGEFPRLQAQAAEANHRIGDIHQRLGRPEQSSAAYRTAIELYTRLLADGAGGDAIRIKLARSCNELGRVLRSMQKQEEAGQVHAQAVRTLLEAPKPFADRPECRYELARSYYTAGQWDFLVGPIGFGFGPPPRPMGPGGFGGGPPKIEFFQGPKRPFGGDPREPHPIHRAVGLLEKLVEEHPSVPEYKHLLACCYRDAPPMWGQPSTQWTPDRSAELLRQLVAEHPKVPDYRFDLCETLRRLPPPRQFGSPPDPKNRERLQEAVDLSADLVALYPNVPQYAAANAQYLDRLGIELYAARDLAAAEKTHRQALTRQTGLVKQYPEAASYAFWLSLMERSLARVLADQGELKEARSRLTSATERLETLRKKDPGAAPLLGMTYRELAGVLNRSGETELALKMSKKAEEFGPPFGPPPFGPPGKFGMPPGRGEKRP